MNDDAARVLVDAVRERGPVGAGFEPRIAVDQHIAGIFRHRACNAAVVRVEAGRKQSLRPLGDAPRHDDRFPARGRAIVHRRVGNVGAKQPRNLRLEFEQHLQRALRDFGLVRRVGGEELAALDQMIDARRHMVAIGTRAEEEGPLARCAAAARECAHMALDREFAGVVRQAGDRALEPRLGRDIGEQVVDRRGADGGEHRRAIVGRKRKITHELLRRRGWFCGKKFDGVR